MPAGGEGPPSAARRADAWRHPHPEQTRCGAIDLTRGLLGPADHTPVFPDFAVNKRRQTEQLDQIVIVCVSIKSNNSGPTQLIAQGLYRGMYQLKLNPASDVHELLIHACVVYLNYLFKRLALFIALRVLAVFSTFSKHNFIPPRSKNTTLPGVARLCYCLRSALFLCFAFSEKTRRSFLRS